MIIKVIACKGGYTTPCKRLNCFACSDRAWTKIANTPACPETLTARTLRRSTSLYQFLGYENACSQPVGLAAIHAIDWTWCVAWLQAKHHDEKAIKKHSQSSKNQLFSDPIKAFRNAIERAGIELPRGQSSHVLRHSFASHFMMNGGNILTLQKILGHHSLDMTIRYAHLAPEHLEEAKALSPYAKLTKT